MDAKTHPREWIWPPDAKVAQSRMIIGSAHIAGNCLNEYGDDLVPTEGWGDRSQNCLHDVRVISDT